MSQFASVVVNLEDECGHGHSLWMKNQYASALLGFCLIATLTYAALHFFSGLDMQLRVVTITAVVSVASLVLSAQISKRREIENELRKLKIPIYQKVFDLFFDAMKSVKDGHGLEENELAERLQTINREMLVWASQKVLAEWARYSHGLRQGVEGPDGLKNAVIRQIELFKAIRLDLGHSVSDADHDSIIKIVFAEDVIEMMKAAPR